MANKFGTIVPYQHPRRPGRNGAEFGRGMAEAEEHPHWRYPLKGGVSDPVVMTETEFGAPVDNVSDVIDIAPVNGPAWRHGSGSMSRVNLRGGYNFFGAEISRSQLHGMGVQLGDDATENQICSGIGFDSYLDHTLMGYADTCKEMSGSGPSCQKYKDILTSADPQEAAIQYIKRFFHVAVKWGLEAKTKYPDSALQKSFNCAAAIYYNAWEQAVGGGDIGPATEETVIWKIAAADRVMALAFRYWESDNPSFQVPWSELSEEQQLVAQPVTTPPLGKSNLPKVAAALAGGIFLFAILGMRKADRQAKEDWKAHGRYHNMPPVNGVDDADVEDDSDLEGG